MGGPNWRQRILKSVSVSYFHRQLPVLNGVDECWLATSVPNKRLAFKDFPLSVLGLQQGHTGHHPLLYMEIIVSTVHEARLNLVGADCDYQVQKDG